MKHFILFVLLFSAISCTRYIHESGEYVVKSLQADTATFHGVKGKYLVPKKVQPNSTIYIKITSIYSKANIFLIK